VKADSANPTTVLEGRQAMVLIELGQAALLRKRTKKMEHAPTEDGTSDDLPGTLRRRSEMEKKLRARPDAGKKKGGRSPQGKEVSWQGSRMA